MTEKKCPACYGTGNMSAYVDVFNGRLVVHVISDSYQECDECDGTGKIKGDSDDSTQIRTEHTQ